MRFVLRALAMTWWLAAAEAAAQTTTEDLKRLTLEELLNVDVTTVSRSPEPTMSVPAAVYVITNDDIRRSGATTIADALRLAPGVQVARINAGTWAIGIRGFADRLARSMLVLIDGRAVYSPLFAGTYWETQDTLLEDVDRIEVIRGPGGTLWGANAVNGIINIITRRARDTTGLVARAVVGNQDRGLGAVRYGAAAGPNWHYRLYAKALDRDAQFHPAGLDFDGLRTGQGGFRADWEPAPDRGVTIQGDVYAARLGQRAMVTTLTPPFTTIEDVDAPLSGGNVLARWFQPAGGGRMQLQTFYTRTDRDERPVSETRDTFDLDFQHALPTAGRHQIVWGAGYRVTSGRIDATAPSEFVPARRTDNLYTGFVQDEITLAAGRMRLTLGSKFERNDYSGAEAQPGVRFLWTPDANRTFWAAATRAVRTPSRVETDYRTMSVVDPAVPVFVRLVPNPSFAPEKLTAYELGYRLRPASTIYLSFAGFYNRHRDILGTDILPAVAEPLPAPARVVIPVQFANGLEGHSYGGEVTGDARLAPWWRWTMNYSYVLIQLSRQPGSLDGSQERRNEGLSPRHQVQLHSSIDLPGRWSLDGFVRYISALRAGPVPAYAAANVRLAWQVTPAFEVSFVGQDLGGDPHDEWAGGSGTTIGIRRSGHVALTWRR